MNTAETSALTPSWARIGKSTVFEQTADGRDGECAQTEDNDFIEDEIPTTDIKYYKPSLAQELQANKGDAAFDYLYDMFFNLPTGEDVKKDLLIVFDGNIGSEETPKFKAWKTKATLTLDHFDSVAEKIYFNFSINHIDRGTVTISDGVPTYTADSAT